MQAKTKVKPELTEYGSSNILIFTMYICNISICIILTVGHGKVMRGIMSKSSTNIFVRNFAFMIRVMNSDP